ncbi:TIGR02679 family protein [Kineococcus sp. NBC_00420]|uniref:TIGR02679 family protein n=1 Tax=unclassified Kineococcus TaxID=2621656 RepID=UPI002E1CA6E0
MSDARLERLLGGPHTRWLVDRVRRRLAAGSTTQGTVTLPRASAEQRAALETLLGRPAGRGRSLSVRLEDVDAVLRTAGLPGLATAVETLTGPVQIRAHLLAERASAWDELVAPLDQVCAVERWADWWAATRDASPLRRTLAAQTDAAGFTASLAAVLDALPGRDEALGAFAQRTCHNPHALDDGPLADLVLAAGARWHDLERPVSAAGRRALWARLGVVRDELSSTVLSLGLPGDGTPTGRALTAWRDTGTPVVLTLRHLARSPLEFPDLAGVTVHVCENPVVVAAAADELAAGAPPLVCTSGRPGAAVVALLRAVLACGGRLAHHGDFDWGGMAIARTVMELGPAEPWRLDADSYRSAVHQHVGRPLRGRAVATPWDPELREAMEENGSGVDEEAVLPELLTDLRRAHRP